VEKVTFHNYSITREGTQPKNANLCPIRNMTSLSDVSQVRAFLGCCQQMSQYIKDYGITAAPLHGLTKKARAFPKPWIKGEDYDLSFESLRSSILDSRNFLHHKNSNERLFIEVPQDGDHARTRWLSVGKVTQQTKAGAGKETPEPGKSSSGSARLGQHSS
jgi:hypothetical protein